MADGYTNTYWQVVNRAWMTGVTIWYVITPDGPTWQSFVKHALQGLGLLIGGAVCVLLAKIAISVVQVLRMNWEGK